MTLLSTGLPGLDCALGGGLPRGLTLLYGGPGSGKTTLCLWLLVKVILGGGWAVLINTGAFRLERLDPIVRGQGGSLKSVLDRVLVASPRSFEEQAQTVHKACAMCLYSEQRLRLIVIDSINELYRLSLGTPGEPRARQSLGYLLTEINEIARAHPTYIVATAQVWSEICTDQVVPVARNLLERHATKVLRLEVLGAALRRVAVVDQNGREAMSIPLRLAGSGFLDAES